MQVSLCLTKVLSEARIQRGGKPGLGVQKLLPSFVAQ